MKEATAMEWKRKGQERVGGGGVERRSRRRTGPFLAQGLRSAALQDITPQNAHPVSVNTGLTLEVETS